MLQSYCQIVPSPEKQRTKGDKKAGGDKKRTLTQNGLILPTDKKNKDRKKSKKEARFYWN